MFEIKCQMLRSEGNSMIKKILFGFVFLVLLSWNNPGMAAVGARAFSLEYSTWNATDIVVATEGEEIDGNVKVLETWKGSLKSKDSIFVAGLASFAPEANRKVSTWTWFGAKKQEPPIYVTGSRLVLFLTRLDDTSDNWQPVDISDDMCVSAVWIEKGKTYGIVQVMNPGPSALTPLPLSEEQMKTRVNDILQIKAAVVKASTITNLAQRADALRPFVNSPDYFARQLALTELPKCGKSALPVLRDILSDKNLLSQHGSIIEIMGKVGGESVGTELTDLVVVETKFWEQTGPKLKPGWWNGTGMQWSEIETLRDRYSKLFAALNVLEQTKYPKCQKAVIRLRDFWRSLPQLDDKSGLDQMSKECDNVLEGLATTHQEQANRTLHPNSQ